MKFLLLIVSAFVITSTSTAQKKCKISTGNWIGNLELNDSTHLPFNLVVTKSKRKTSITVLNGEEEIKMTEGKCEKDTFRFVFPLFNSELVFHVTSPTEISGYWINHLRTNYTIPFTGKYTSSQRFPVSSDLPPADFNGRWETQFTKDGVFEYTALGIFQQNKTTASGTFLTETGDYRFLEGNVYGNTIYLSCFDGSHAFLFKAKQNEQGKLNGEFYSGKHWKSEWSATRNDQFELPNPDSLTYVKENADPLSFTLNTIDGKEYAYPNETLKNKVVIIQILGTWCPNCMDETRYYKELYAKYHDQGLEIISIGYEATSDPARHIEALKSYKKKLGLDFTFLVGGEASKGLASEHFPMLSEIISFPTSIFIDKNGTIQRIHTGFNGPGTGEYYQEYIKKTEKLIVELLGN